MKVLLILGANLGDRKKNLEVAVELIRFHAGKVLRETEPIETPPFGVKNQPYFLNKGVLISPFHPPFELLKVLKWIEKRVGRYPTYRWGPRVVDIDIVTYGNLKIDTPFLTVPHPGLRDREFFRSIYTELTGTCPLP